MDPGNERTMLLTTTRPKTSATRLQLDSRCAAVFKSFWYQPTEAFLERSTPATTLKMSSAPAPTPTPLFLTDSGREKLKEIAVWDRKFDLG